MKMRSISERVAAMMCLLAVASGISAHAQSIIPQKDEKKGLWGYVSKSDGKWVVKPKFDDATELTASPNGQLRGTVTQKGKKGFIDDSGKILGAGVVFEEITPMQGDALFVKVKGKTGVADYSGVYKVKPEIIDTTDLSGEGYIANMKGKKGFLNYDGTWMLEPIYNDIDTGVEGYLLVNKGGKAGISDRNGSMLLIPGNFSEVEPFGEYWKVKKGKKVGLYNLKENSLLIKPEYYDVKQPIVYPNGYTLYIVSDKPEKWGAMTAQGKNVVKKNFSNIVPINAINALLLFEGPQPKRIFFAGDKKPYKVKNYSKKPIQSGFSSLSLTYNKDWTDHSVELVELPNGEVIEGGWNKVRKINQFYVCTNNGKTTFFKDGTVFLEVPSVYPDTFNNWTLAGDVVISPDNKIFKDFTYNGKSLLIKVENENYLALPNGKLSSIPLDAAESISQNLLSAQQGKTAYLLSRDGDILTQGDYDRYLFEGGIIKTVKNGKNGVIDNKTFETVLLPEYDDIESYGNDLYMIKNDSKCGLFNHVSGNWYLNPEYDNIEKYGDDLYMIKNGSKCGLFNPVTGNWYLKPIYDKITRDEKNEERAEIKIGENVGFIDLTSGKIIVPIERGYNSIGNFYDDYAYVNKNGKMGVIKSNGNEIIPAVYDDIERDDNLLCAKKGKTISNFDLNGKSVTIKKEIEITDSGVALGGLGYTIHFSGYKGHSIQLIFNIYKKGGKKVDWFKTDEYNITANKYKISDIFHLPENTLYRYVDYYCVLVVKDLTTGTTYTPKSRNKLSFIKN